MRDGVFQRHADLLRRPHLYARLDILQANRVLLLKGTLLVFENAFVEVEDFLL